MSYVFGSVFVPIFHFSGSSTSSKEAMVFQIQRSRLRLIRVENPSIINVCNSWRVLENYLARRLLSFSQSKAAFQFRITDHNKRPYLTVSCKSEQFVCLQFLTETESSSRKGLELTVFFLSCKRFSPSKT